MHVIVSDCIRENKSDDKHFSYNSSKDKCDNEWTLGLYKLK